MPSRHHVAGICFSFLVEISSVVEARKRSEAGVGHERRCQFLHTEVSVRGMEQQKPIRLKFLEIELQRFFLHEVGRY